MTRRERERALRRLWVMVGLWVLLLASLANAAEGAELTAAAQAQPVNITLKGSNTVDRADVMLSDVFDGLSAGQDCVIAAAPLPGKKITYDVTVLTRTAMMYRLPWRARSLSDSITLTRAANSITAQMVSDVIAGRYRELGAEGELTVQLDQSGFKLDMPTDIQPTLALVGLQQDKENARFVADFDIASGTPAAKRVTLMGRIVARIAIPVLNKPLNTGDIINAADLDTIMLPSDRANSLVKLDADLIGKAAKRTLSANQPLRPGDIAPPRVVTNGQLVTVLVSTPVMQLTAQGRALQDGALGDTIRIVNTQSNRTLQGKVEGDGLVRITIGMPPAMAATPAAAPGTQRTSALAAPALTTIATADHSAALPPVGAPVLMDVQTELQQAKHEGVMQ